jgi:hypothetical protein
VRQGPGWWYNQAKPGVRNANDLTDPRMQCYLGIVDQMSAVFNKTRDASSFDAAVAVLKGPGPAPTDQLDRALLTAWLNFANGSIGWTQQVDTNGDAKPDKAFSAVMTTAEQVRLNPASTKAALQAQKAILDVIDGSD